jgi:hypothetical protein
MRDQERSNTTTKDLLYILKENKNSIYFLGFKVKKTSACEEYFDKIDLKKKLSPLIAFFKG